MDAAGDQLPEEDALYVENLGLPWETVKVGPSGKSWPVVIVSQCAGDEPSILVFSSDMRLEKTVLFFVLFPRMALHWQASVSFASGMLGENARRIPPELFPWEMSLPSAPPR